MSAIPDQDTFYDVTDSLEELGMDGVTQRHMNKPGADLDLITQFQVYEGSLRHEDGEDFSGIPQAENLRWNSDLIIKNLIQFLIYLCIKTPVHLNNWLTLLKKLLKF